MSCKPIVFTFSTLSREDHPGLKRFCRTMEKFGWDFDLSVASWPGESSMWDMFWSSLQTYREKGYTHALRLDAWDTICYGPPTELPAAMAAYEHPSLLISAELACWPGDHRKSEYPPLATPWRYAHSPVTVDLGKELSQQVFKNKHTDYGADQKHFGDLVLDHVPGVAIDTKCRVVQAIGHCHPWENCFEIIAGRVKNKLTGTYPLFVHGNGRTSLEWCP